MSAAVTAAGGTRIVDLVYFDAGGGHRASALALEAAIRRAGLPWTVRRVNLRSVLDPKDSFRRFTGMDPEDVYNKRLARGWTLGLAQELKLLQGMIRWGHAKLLRPLQQHWLATEPDMVVSLIPNFNRALCESLASTLPGVPYVTVLTDLADHPPNFWIERGMDQHLVCGSPRAVAQARAAGHADDRIHASSGMLMRAEFHEPGTVDRRAERALLGMDPERPTGLVLFGGQGSKAMLGIAKRLPDTQLILACGHNAALAQSLRELPARAPRLVLGFTPDIARHMQLADFFIGKPGPGCLSEAVQMQLPVIVVRNRWTLPQERYNAQWVRERGVGLVCGSYAGVAPAVAELVSNLDRYQAATRRVENRALYELPEILGRIMARAEAVSRGPSMQLAPEDLARG
ncbi:glycosyltransferase [Variovorax sp. J22P168]|uniref:glycosyltransferase n=1 Tax=Variovorax jilinensis TaxID=3053513 RepID=UPI0025790EE0|nr:glycosyltransferase [Variovorax sp. J22P168]MDM0012329.1 glycosyltransferase [Variovorax sp. J22P168]